MIDIIETIKVRFRNNMNRHNSVTWEEVEPLLEVKKDRIKWMEESGGEPDIILINGDLLLVDFAKETPKGRRGLCYDKDARIKRKKFPPKSSAIEECVKNSVQIVDEEIYKHIQLIEPLDEKTSSWILTPQEIRKNGGAIFMDRRYNCVFLYHNGADSYYSTRGFRTYIVL